MQDRYGVEHFDTWITPSVIMYSSYKLLKMDQFFYQLCKA